MYKNPGEEERAVIDLRKSEATAVINFVCFNRAKWLVDLLVEPMSFDRLSKIEKHPTLRLRLVEKDRLIALAVAIFCERWGIEEGISDLFRGALCVDTLATIG